MYSFFFILLAFFLVFIYLFSLSLKKQHVTSQKVRLNQITVLIPFRNEGGNLPNIIQSILNSENLPFEFIFINDHSEDEYIKYFEKLNNVPFKLIHLEQNETGKKHAIRKGIKNCLTEFVLTLDADVNFSPKYFSSIENLPKYDLYVLPVQMKARNWISTFAELDYYYLNALSFSLSNIYRPFIANGANLLFNKKKFIAYDSFLIHQNIQSGDDLFLLKDFVKNNAQISVFMEKELIVSSKTPNSWKDFLFQRVRWIKKTKYVHDAFANFIGIYGLITLLLFVLSIFLEKNHILIPVKIGIDFIIFLPYLIKIGRLKICLSTFLFSILQIPYYILIGFLTLFLNIHWKNRKI